MSDDRENETNPQALFEKDALGAWCELMVLAANADGELGDDERDALAKHVETLSDKRLDKEQLTAFIREAEARAKGASRKERLDTIGRQLGDAKKREIAFELTVRVVAADGVLRTSERELLMESAEALGIDGDRAADLVKRFAAPGA
jgi:uncharacterized tellurite resistance protein B-like protein